MSGKKDHNDGFKHAVVPLRGRYAGQTILVSKFQKERLLKLKKARLPDGKEKGTGKVDPPAKQEKEKVDTKEEKGANQTK